MDKDTDRGKVHGIAPHNQSNGQDVVPKHLPVVFSSLLAVDHEQLVEPPTELGEIVKLGKCWERDDRVCAPELLGRCWRGILTEDNLRTKIRPWQGERRRKAVLTTPNVQYIEQYSQLQPCSANRVTVCSLFFLAFAYSLSCPLTLGGLGRHIRIKGEKTPFMAASRSTVNASAQKTTKQASRGPLSYSVCADGWASGSVMGYDKVTKGRRDCGT